MSIVCFSSLLASPPTLTLQLCSGFSGWSGSGLEMNLDRWDCRCQNYFQNSPLLADAAGNDGLWILELEPQVRKRLGL